MSGTGFGVFLKELRRQHGYKTQKHLAEVSGVSQTTLSRIEAGTQRPQPETLMVLAKHLSSYTYGELMEKAGYFEGLPKDDRTFVMDLFNEEEEVELEMVLFKTIDTMSKNKSFDVKVTEFLKTELGPLLESEGWNDIEYSPVDLKQLSKELNLEYKRILLDRLERAMQLSYLHDDDSTIAAHHDGEDWTEEELEEIERFKQFVKMKRGPRAGE